MILLGGGNMLFADKRGALLQSEEVDSLPLWELEERGIHVFENEETGYSS